MANIFPLSRTTCFAIIAAALFLFLWMRFSFLPLTDGGDSVSYIAVAEWMSGDPVSPSDIYPARFLKPLAPLGIALLSPLAGDPILAFLILNILSYIALAAASWFFFLRFFVNDESALWGTLILISAYPVLFYGLDLYTDMGSWVLFVVTLTLIIGYARAPSPRAALVVGVSVAVGVLWKEYSVIAGLSAALMLLFVSYRSMAQRSGDLLLMSVPGIIALCGAQYFVWSTFGYSYLDWYKTGTTPIPGISEYTLPHIIKSLIGTVFFAWIPALLGVIRFPALGSTERRIVLSFALPLTLIFLWGFVSTRLYFIVAPFVALLAVHGIMLFGKNFWWRALCVLGIVMTNCFWTIGVSELRPILAGFIS